MKNAVFMLLMLPFLSLSEADNQLRQKADAAIHVVELHQATQCKGKTTTGARCRNTTKDPSGYCYVHKRQANPGYRPSSNKLDASVRCIANTKSGTRCKRNTYCTNKKCSSHGGNCY